MQGPKPVTPSPLPSTSQLKSTAVEGPASASQSSVGPMRLASIDVYRGTVMFLMLAEVLHLSGFREIFQEDNWLGKIAEFVRFHTSHVEWTGCSLHDMIQPSFTFLVGTSMALSLLARKAKGHSYRAMLTHAVGRSIILVSLGIFLRSLGKESTNFTFDDTLTQIGLGYWILFLVSTLSLRWLWGVLVLVLVGYWGAFVLYPAPVDFPYTSYGVPANWPEHWNTGLATHFNKNSNLAWAFDRWWMNLFPREKPFEFSAGGYATLSFVPTFGTMVLGLIAGKWLVASDSYRRKWLGLVAMGIACMLVAFAVERLGVCPIVKRIWTPTWTLWSGGICFVWLAALGVLCDQWNFKLWAFPLLVIGSNSIVAYCMSWTLEQPTHAALKRHFGGWIESTAQWAYGIAKPDSAVNTDDAHSVEKFLMGALTLVVFWLILFWLHRRKIYVRI